MIKRDKHTNIKTSAFEYILYLSKHNYGNIFNIDAHGELNKLGYRELFITKNVSILHKCNHNDSYKHFLNNNLVCSKCMYSKKVNTIDQRLSRNRLCFKNVKFNVDYSFNIQKKITTIEPDDDFNCNNSYYQHVNIND